MSMHFSVLTRNVRFWYRTWIKLITLSERTRESEQIRLLVFSGNNSRLFQTVFRFAFFGNLIFVSDQNVNAKSNRNRLGIQRVARWIISFKYLS